MEKSFFVLVLLVLAGWIADRAILVERLNLIVADRSLSNHPVRPCPLARMEDHFSIFPRANPTLFHKSSEFRVTFQILKCWQLWRNTKDERLVKYSSTALGMLDCATVEDFLDRHLIVSKHVKIELAQNDQISLKQFITFAIDHE